MAQHGPGLDNPRGQPPPREEAVCSPARRGGETPELQLGPYTEGRIRDGRIPRHDLREGSPLILGPECSFGALGRVGSLCLYMYVCMHACMHACMYVCMYVCMYAFMHSCMYVCMYVRAYVCMYACMHVCMYACIYAVCMHVCTHVCMYAYYVCMHESIYACMHVCV